MRNGIRFGLLALGLSTVVSGCDLTGPKLSDNPNDPSAASNVSLLSAAQANLWVQSEADLARTVCVWMQQCSGRQSQYVGVGNYSTIADGDFWYQYYAATYGGGGLIDLRRIQSSSLQAGDSNFAGVAAVMEVWLVGTAADIWGDVPYSQAATSVTNPVLDPQQQVYDHLQAKLDSAIAFLSDTGGRNIGPKGAELVYGGDDSLWIRMAETLKARYFMHVAERIPAAYDSALFHAQRGIRQGQDYNNYHTSVLTSSNIWFQFFTTAALNYVAAGQYLVDQLKNTSDPRLRKYYSGTPVDTSVFAGGLPDGSDGLTAGTISSLSATRLAPDFQQPLVTWAETQLIIAEANYSKATSNEAAARTALNNVLATVPMPPVGGGVTGPALLNAIMTEKYIQLFQTIEVWSDYRRTCLPTMVAFPTGYTRLPRRLPYPLQERNANTSIPDAGPDPFTGGNWNDPNPCP